MIHNIVVLASLPDEEINRRYQLFVDFLQAETPGQLYRFRQCNERSFAAFDQDQLWFSPGYKMNDDIDALLHFDKEYIKSEPRTFIESEHFTSGIQLIGQGTDGFSHIHDLLPPEIIEATRQNIAQVDQASMDAAKKQFYYLFTDQIDTNASNITQFCLGKFACIAVINQACFAPLVRQGLDKCHQYRPVTLKQN